MSSQTSEGNHSKLLLVEGNDDLRFFGAMVRHLEASDIAIDSYNGKPNLRNDLSERVRNPDFQEISSLGIVRDADNSAISAFDSVAGSLRRVGLPTPSGPAQPEVLNGLRVSVLIIPPGSGEGELEDLCLHSIEGSLDMECVESYFDCLSNVKPPIAANRIAKSRLHAFLAPGPVYTTQNNEILRRQPGLRLGEAAEAGVWDWSSPVFQPVIGFILSL